MSITITVRLDHDDWQHLVSVLSVAVPHGSASNGKSGKHSSDWDVCVRKTERIKINIDGQVRDQMICLNEVDKQRWSKL